jgi:hypothetical protein
MNKCFIPALAAAFMTVSAMADSPKGTAPAEINYWPDNAVTPGLANPKVTQRNIKRTICSPRWVKSARPPDRFFATAETAQFERASSALKDPAHYEIDHRIPIEVGGHPRDAANLWAQPLRIEWNALVKDKLETYIQGEVCARRMKLAEGQAVFQRDWVDVFRQYCGPDPGAACNPPGTEGVQIEDPKRPGR